MNTGVNKYWWNHKTLQSELHVQSKLFSSLWVPCSGGDRLEWNSPGGGVREGLQEPFLEDGRVLGQELLSEHPLFVTTNICIDFCRHCQPPLINLLSTKVYDLEINKHLTKWSTVQIWLAGYKEILHLLYSDLFGYKKFSSKKQQILLDYICLEEEREMWAEGVSLDPRGTLTPRNFPV